VISGQWSVTSQSGETGQWSLTTDDFRLECGRYE
jgi:hypothetical protein